MTNPMRKICGAHSRRTGQPCQSAPMTNGRCRMHGGASTGRPQTTGEHTKEAKAQRKRLRELIRGMRALMGDKHLA